MRTSFTANARRSSEGTVPPFVTRGVFHDFELFKDATRGWNFDWRQLDRGPLTASVGQVATGSAQIGQAAFSRAFEQQGASPSGTRSFAFVGRGVQGTRWCGWPITDDKVVIFDRAGEFDALSTPGFLIHTVALSDEIVAETCRTLEVAGLERLLADGSARVRSSDSGAVESLRRATGRVWDALATASAPDRLTGLDDELESEIPVRLLGALAAGQEAPSPPSFGTRQLAMQRALPFIEAHVDRAITVSELCRATRLGRRTLEYAFKEHLGLSPRAYLVARRLDGVRRELVPSDPPVKIADVADRWGFWHLGQFAADYRRQFGELPSETLRRRGGVRARS